MDELKAVVFDKDELQSGDLLAVVALFPDLANQNSNSDV